MLAKGEYHQYSSVLTVRQQVCCYIRVHQHHHVQCDDTMETAISSTPIDFTLKSAAAAAANNNNHQPYSYRAPSPAPMTGSRSPSPVNHHHHHHSNGLHGLFLGKNSLHPNSSAFRVVTPKGKNEGPTLFSPASGAPAAVTAAAAAATSLAGLSYYSRLWSAAPLVKAGSHDKSTGPREPAALPLTARFPAPSTPSPPPSAEAQSK
ncbi:hypothetical protein B566_EDAN005392, partial [Ephemera danica]